MVGSTTYGLYLDCDMATKSWTTLLYVGAGYCGGAHYATPVSLTVVDCDPVSIFTRFTHCSPAENFYFVIYEAP